MNNIYVSKTGCKTNNTSMEEIFVLLLFLNKVNIDSTKKSLIDKGYIATDYDIESKPIGFRITAKGGELINKVIIDSEKYSSTDEDSLLTLAKELKELFPKGKKPGTNYYWTEGAPLIVRRLKLFFKKYNKYPNEDIITATKAYVSSFNGDYTWMRLLKYFILKESKNALGEVESTSDLLNYIENKDQVNTNSNDWLDRVI